MGLLGCLLLVVSQGRRFALRNSLSVVVSLYVGLCLASLIWADTTDMSLKRFLMSFLCVLGVMGICRHFSPSELCKIVLLISFTYLCIGVVVELLGLGVARIAEGGRYRFGGTMHTNAQAVNCAFLCITSGCLLRGATRWRGALLGIFMAGLVFLVLTGSRGALYSLLLAGAAYWWLNSSGHSRALGLTAFPALATFVLLASLMLGVQTDQFVEITQLGRDRASVSTMTGRFPLWAELFGYVQTRPLLGYGYQSFWNLDRYVELAATRGWIPTHSHSAYLDTILSVGLVGACLYLLAIVMGLRLAYKYHAQTGDAGYRFFMIVLLMVPIYSITESRYAAPSCFYSMIFFSALFFLRSALVRSNSPRIAPPRMFVGRVHHVSVTHQIVRDR